MPCIYILYSKQIDQYYTGSSRKDEPSKRIRAHNDGKTRSTKFGRPWKLIHIEKFKSYTEARKRELFLKSGQGRKILKKILK